MRLDVVAAPVAGLGLSAILLDPQITMVNGFPLSLSGNGLSAAAITSGSGGSNIRRVGVGIGQQRRQQRQRSLFSRQMGSQSQSSFLSTNNDEPHRDGNVSSRSHTRLSARSGGGSDEGEYVDAVVEEKTAGLALDDEENTSAKERKPDVFKKALQNLASLSLIDYKWRSGLFKKQEAERLEEEWMAKMMGEDPAYARPMDAGDETRGPLGNAEKSAVQWLTSVIEEEGRRARLIAESDGELVRPKDLSPADEAGPLSELERRAVRFLGDISESEVGRLREGSIRPKDATNPGPLGEAEARAVLALDRIVESERLRLDQSRMRGGEVVRPIDVPGPLGEFERYVGDIIRAEKQRVKDREANGGNVVRPKDASIQSGLSEVERKAVDDWESLRKEESHRLFSLQRFLNERRPMDADADSPLGVTEAFTVGLMRAPQLLGKVLDRVKELLNSEEMEGQDQDILQQILPAKSSGDSEKRNPSDPSPDEDDAAQ